MEFQDHLPSAADAQGGHNATRWQMIRDLR